MTGSEGAAEEAPAKRSLVSRLFRSRARISTDKAPDDESGAPLDAAGLPASLALTSGDVGQDSDVETEEVELYPRRPLVRPLSTLRNLSYSVQGV
jgi:hypothetical protein